MQGVLYAVESTSGERRLAEGCWRAGPRFWVQTQHDENANEGIAPGKALCGDSVRAG